MGDIFKRKAVQDSATAGAYILKVFPDIASNKADRATCNPLVMWTNGAQPLDTHLAKTRDREIVQSDLLKQKRGDLAEARPPQM